MKIEKIADETLDFMQDRVKKYDDYKNNDKVKSLYRLADKTLELDQRLEEKDADQMCIRDRLQTDQQLLCHSMPPVPVPPHFPAQTGRFPYLSHNLRCV